MPNKKNLEMKVFVPKAVRDNAEKGLRLHYSLRRGGTRVGVNMAKKLVEKGYIELLHMKKINQYFPRHAGDNLEQDGKDGGPVSNGYIAWMLWGGDAGWDWSEKVLENLKGGYYAVNV